MNLDEAQRAFITESRELLEQMESALLHIEQYPDDADAINAIFRAAHTIKGSAGIFGLNHIVAFTHVVENVLDQVREGRLQIDAALANLLLSAGDHIHHLVEDMAQGREPDQASQVTGEAISLKLTAVLAGMGTASTLPALSVEAAPQASEQATNIEPTSLGGGGVVSSDHWHLSVRFGPDTIREGFDPFSFIRYLGTLGRIHRIVTLSDNVPRLSELEPDACHLGFEINFESDADKATLEGVFDFVREGSQVSILPPRSKLSEYLALIAELPEPDMRLGEILVRCGSLTQAELDAAWTSKPWPRTRASPWPHWAACCWSASRCCPRCWMRPCRASRRAAKPARARPACCVWTPPSWTA